MRSVSRSVLVPLGLLLLLHAPGKLQAQGLTGQISGSVVDPRSASVAGAKVILSNTATGQTRDGVTDTLGAFVFTELLPGVYQLAVEAPGFKRYEEKDINLSANERVTVRQVVLALGQVSETLSVTANAAMLETQSSERAGLVSGTELQGLELKGRDYMGMMHLLPGVVDSTDRNAPGFSILPGGNGGIVGLNFNGGRQDYVDMTLDGVTNIETGSNQGPWISPSLDSVAEMKVLLTNYQAEYGRSSAATINVITKSGTQDFHGEAYYFFRNEALNADQFFNNVHGVPRPYYRYNDVGYTLGGPLLIPHLQNRKDKLFFFWSQEFLPRDEPQSQLTFTMPTALQREGNFSQTVATNGQLIPVEDPLNNKTPFPGNIIPTSRINPAGQKLLGIFPLPNAVGPSNTYNYVNTPITDHPWVEETLRVDYNISEKNLFYIRLVKSNEHLKSPYDTSLGATSWGQFPTDYAISGDGLASTLIHTFNPSMVNELTFGVTRGVQRISPLNAAALAANSRMALGIDLPQFYPNNNPLNLVPNAAFSGVSDAPALAIEARFPYHGNGNLWDWTDNLTKVIGSHNIKVGIFVENAVRNGPRTSDATGQFSFNVDVNNPYDTNFPYSNALLGSVDSYAESNIRPISHSHFQNVEWFAQDNWRVTKRFTIDVGARFYYIVPSYLVGGSPGSVFSPSLFNPASAPALIQPYSAGPGSPRQGVNPITGQVVSQILIGTYAPNSGNPFNGTTVSSTVMKTPPIELTPRFGFAWDVFGDGKTAVRGGFGIFLDRNSDTIITAFTQLPPVTITETAYYTTIPQLLNTSLALSPTNINAIQSTYRPQAVYQYSFGIQRDVGFGTVLDVAYAGNVGRHLQQLADLNVAPYGTDFLPSSQDPTNPGHPLPANFLRPYRGYGDIGYYEYAGISNYNSMQTQVHKRFSNSLTFGAAWTWSKTMDLVDTEGSAINSLMDPGMRNYGKAGFDHTHNLNITYIYSLPRPFAHWDNAFSRAALGNWQVSGITSFISGVPLGLSYSFVQSVDITGTTGTGIDSRVILTCDPILPKSQRTIYHSLNTSCVAPPLASNFGIGNAPKDVIRGPGTNTWNISLFKNFPLGKNEERRIEFRAETFNTFNHPSFSAVNTAAQFNAAGQQVNGSLGAYTATLPPRQMSLGLKVYF